MLLPLIENNQTAMNWMEMISFTPSRIPVLREVPSLLYSSVRCLCWPGRLSIIALTGGAIVEHFHEPLGRWINETLASGLPVPPGPIHLSAVSFALQEHYAHQDDAIHRQIHDQPESDMGKEQQHRRANQGEQTIANDHPPQHTAPYLSGSTTTAVP